MQNLYMQNFITVLGVSCVVSEKMSSYHNTVTQNLNTSVVFSYCRSVCVFVCAAETVCLVFPGPRVSACSGLPLQQAGKQGFEFQ